MAFNDLLYLSNTICHQDHLRHLNCLYFDAVTMTILTTSNTFTHKPFITAQWAILVPLLAYVGNKQPTNYNISGLYFLWSIQGGLLVDYLPNTRDS